MADNVIHISEQARERYHDCMKAIDEARAWAQGTDLVFDALLGEDLKAQGETALAIVREREALVVEMERSFHANVSRMFFRPASDGMLTFHTDIAPLSFFWRYESGYHGGLIFHSTHRGSERLPVGVWSVHT